MNNYYYNYLIKSKCYINLSSAITMVNTQLSNVRSLKSILSEGSGNNIELMITDLDQIITDLNNYVTSLTSIKDQLTTNANTFDVVLNNWKEKKGQVLDTNFYNSNGTLVSGAYIPHSSLSSVTYVYQKGEKKVSDISVDPETNYIKVVEKETLRKYSSRVAHSVSTICLTGACIASTESTTEKVYDFNGNVIK